MDNLEAQTDSKLEVNDEINRILLPCKEQSGSFFLIIGVVLHLNTAVGHAHSLLGWDMQIRIRECYYGVIWRTCKLQ